MNQTGKFTELLKQTRNPNLEMFNIKRWLQLNNDDGKYNLILQEFNKNPEMNKLDLLNYIDKTSIDGKYDKLRGKMNFETAADDAIRYMKKNNQVGTYS